MTLSHQKPRIVGVTGSVGKTSTKDAIFTAFSSCVRVRKSDKSFNSDVGVPLTILGLPNAWRNLYGWLKNIVRGLWPVYFQKNYPQWLILEVGADRPGDIERIATWVRPDVTVITLLPDVPVHIEYFKTPEEVIREKMFLAHAIVEGGMLVGNGDDAAIVDAFKKTGKQYLLYGFSEQAHVVAHEYAVRYEGVDSAKRPVGISVCVTVEGETYTILLDGLLGKQHVYPILAALACTKAVGLSLQLAAAALCTHIGAPGRMRLHAGMNNSTIIDDTYNASPAAVSMALSALKELSVVGRKIVVLGDMLELGTYSVAEHQAIGREAAFADVVVTVGPRARDIALTAGTAGVDAMHIIECADATAAGAHVASILKEGDVVLVKGSQGIRMEKTVAHLLADRALAPHVLVRQEREWKSR